jgi:hypothetical protein
VCVCVCDINMYIWICVRMSERRAKTCSRRIQTRLTVVMIRRPAQTTMGFSNNLFLLSNSTSKTKEVNATVNNTLVVLRHLFECGFHGNHFTKNGALLPDRKRQLHILFRFFYPLPVSPSSSLAP